MLEFSECEDGPAIAFGLWRDGAEYGAVDDAGGPMKAFAAASVGNFLNLALLIQLGPFIPSLLSSLTLERGRFGQLLKGTYAGYPFTCASASGQVR